MPGPSGPDPDQQAGTVSVPRTNLDPVWSLRPWALAVSLGPYAFEIPALPASEWLAVVMDPHFSWDAILPGLLDSKDQDLINEMILNGSIDVDDFYDTCRQVWATVTSRSWWVALRLVGTAIGTWSTVGAELLLAGVDAEKISIAGWLDVMTLVLIRNMKPEEVTMFSLKLESPPEGEKLDEQSMEMDASAFMSMA